MKKRTFLKISTLMGAGAVLDNSLTGCSFGGRGSSIEIVKATNIEEVKRNIPVYHEVDVWVCGGGLGGTSAALASARAGAKTLLVERNAYLGGIATAGMCCSVFNCYFTGEEETQAGNTRHSP